MQRTLESISDYSETSYPPPPPQTIVSKTLMIQAIKIAPFTVIVKMSLESRQLFPKDKIKINLKTCI